MSRLAGEVADAADEKPRSHSRAGLYRASGLAGEVVDAADAKQRTHGDSTRQRGGRRSRREAKEPQ
jgi:hypothetical protein